MNGPSTTHTDSGRHLALLALGLGAAAPTLWGWSFSWFLTTGARP